MAIDFNQILNYYFWNNSLKEYLIAFGVFILVIIILKVFKKTIIKKLKKLADHTRIEFDDLIIKIIDSIGWPFYLFFSLYLAFQFIQLPDVVEKIVFYVLLIVVIYYVVRGVQELIDYGVQKLIKQKQEQEKEKFDPSVIKLISKILKGLLWGFAIIIILQNVKYILNMLYCLAC